MQRLCSEEAAKDIEACCILWAYLRYPGTLTNIQMDASKSVRFKERILIGQAYVEKLMTGGRPVSKNRAANIVMEIQFVAAGLS